MKGIKKYIAEFIGTMVLVLFGCGVAVATACYGNDGIIATALAFGFSIIAMAYLIGEISGCHVNPAVSLAMFITKKLSKTDLIYYIISQTLGAVAGCALIALFFGSFEFLGANQAQYALDYAYGDTGALFVALATEIVLSFIFVFVVLGVTAKTENKKISGVSIGLTLTLVHLLGIRLTGTSVNPARSLAPALLEMIGGSFEPISQIWIFIIGPCLGAIIAAYVYKMMFCECEDECDCMICDMGKDE